MQSSGIATFFSNRLLAVFLIVLTGAVVYNNSLRGEFLYDDVRTIVENDRIRDVSNYLGFDRVFQKRPFADLTFSLNYRFGGLNTFGYHLVNLLIHLLNGVVVYFLSAAVLSRIFTAFQDDVFFSSAQCTKKKRLISNSDEPAGFNVINQIPLMALFAALIFIAHPIQTQAVSYISQRYASLAAFFYLLSVFCYLKGRVAQRTPIGEEGALSSSEQMAGAPFRSIPILPFPFFYLLCGVFGSLAFLSKQNAASLPLTLFLVEYFCVDSVWGGWKKKGVWIGVAALTGGVIALFFVNFFHEIDSLRTLAEDVAAASRDSKVVSRWQYFCTQFCVIPIYIRLLLFPVGQNADPRFPFKEGFFDGWTFLGFCFLCSIILASILFRKRVPVVSFGVLWFFITLSVESSIIPIRDAMFEHRLYLPAFGFCLSVSYFVLSVFNKRRFLGSFVCVAIIAGFGFGAYQRNEIWQSSKALWEDVLTKSPWNNRAYTNLGIELAREGELAEAISRFQESLKLQPGDPLTLLNLGNALAMSGQYTEAVSIYTKLIAHDPNNPRAHFNMGTTLGHMGKLSLAEGYFREALRLLPGFVDAKINLGMALMKQKRFDDAIRCLQEVLQADEKQKDAHVYLGLALAKKGKLKEAGDAFGMAVKLDPLYVRARVNLGTVLAQQGRIDDAIYQFTEVLKLEPNYSVAVRNLEILRRKKAQR